MHVLAVHSLRVWTLGLASLVLACGDNGGATNASATETTATTTTTTTNTTSATEVTTGAMACPGDSLEPNNVPADAALIGDGEFESVVCPFDIDYYALEVSQETYLSAILYLAREDGLLALDLLGPEMQTMRWSSGSKEVPAYPLLAIEAIHARLASPGTYLLRVTHYSGTVMPYSLVVQRFVDETP